VELSLLAWCQWLQQTPVAVRITESSWLFPVIEGSHILALSLSVGMIVLLDIRLLGLAFRSEAVSRIMQQLMPWSMTGFAVMFITGAFLFITQAGKAYGNAFFRTKLMFLLLLGINAAVYQKKFYPNMAEWDLAGTTPAGARFCAGFSLIAWLVVIVCGRTMAYEF
jgi:hypothetical protein